MSREFLDVEEIESPHFIYKGNQVQLLPTILRMIFRTFARTPTSYFKIRRLIKKFQPDLLITDAEPISHLAAYFSGIKRLSIDNPQSMIHREYTVEKDEYLSWFTLMIAVKLSMWNADKYLIYDFSDEQIDNPRIHFVKPLIQEGILRQHPRYGDHVFVYQTSMSTEFICEILKQLDEQFIIYGFNKDLVDENLVFKQFNDDEFYEDIAHAKAVITNGGFTVLSEALYLKKPVFSLPIQKQFEQILNGKFIQQLGAGVYHKNLDKENLRTFFNNLELYQKNLEKYNPGNPEETLHRIEQEIQQLISHSS